MTNNKKLLKEFINAVIDLYLEESVSATRSTVSTSGTRGTTGTIGTGSTRSSTSSTNTSSTLSKGEAEIDSAAQGDQDDLSAAVDANNLAIRQAGEVAGKMSAATNRMKNSNMNIQTKEQQIADANKVLARSENKKEREQAFNDVAQASTDMAGEVGKIVDDQDAVANAFRRQSDAATKMKP